MLLLSKGYRKPFKLWIISYEHKHYCWHASLSNLVYISHFPTIYRSNNSLGQIQVSPSQVEGSASQDKSTELLNIFSGSIFPASWAVWEVESLHQASCIAVITKHLGKVACPLCISFCICQTGICWSPFTTLSLPSPGGISKLSQWALIKLTVVLWWLTPGIVYNECYGFTSLQCDTLETLKFSHRRPSSFYIQNFPESTF